MASRGIQTDPFVYRNLSTDTDLALEAGVKYTLRNKSSSRLYLLERDTAEHIALDSEEVSIRRDFVDPWDSAIVSYSADTHLHAWYENIDGGTIAMVEV